MANISSASGTITLKGNWTQKAIDALIPVLDSWEFYGQYGIQWYGSLSLKQKTTNFSGCGRWSFSGTLDSFHEWTLDWIKTHSNSEHHPLTMEQYNELLHLMHEKNLKLEFTFEDDEEGVGFQVKETGEFTSNGESLSYETICCEEMEDTWESLGCESFDSAVEFFSQFTVDAEKKELQKWVKDCVFPDECYLYTEEEMDVYGFLEDNFADYGFVEESNNLCDFMNRFTLNPDSAWSCLLDFTKDYYGWNVQKMLEDSFEPLTLDSDEEFDEWYDILCNGEDDLDELPNYPTEEITSLTFQGTRFVLTGEFQNNHDRDQIQALIEGKGGKCTAAISGKTNYLVIGDFGDAGDSKIKKALAEKEKRDDIKIITESDLFRFL